MIALVELIFTIMEILLSWRLLLGMAMTLSAVLVIVGIIPHEPTQYIIAVPVGVVGIFLSFRWQIRADASESSKP